MRASAAPGGIQDTMVRQAADAAKTRSTRVAPRRTTQLLALAHDLLWVPLAVFLAFWLRQNMGSLNQLLTSNLFEMVAVMVPAQTLALLYCRVPRGIWRFVSLADVQRIFKSTLIGAALGFLALFLLDRLDGIPRSVIVLYPCILAAGTLGTRVALRWHVSQGLGSNGLIVRPVGPSALVLGAGDAGELLVRDLLRTGAYRPIALLDDAESKVGRELHGVPILGRTSTLASQLERLQPSAVLIAIPSAPGQLIRQIYDVCRAANVKCVTLPSIRELASGHLGVSRLREIQLEDLLGRQVVDIDRFALRGLLEGKRILVTGAGGSIGSELTRQIAVERPAQLVLVDHAEFNLYSIERELWEQHRTLPITATLADVADQGRMNEIFERHRPEIVLHAAAYKHVPMIEANPLAGIRTNVLGTTVVADLAMRYGTQTFVAVSTDKAVNPTNVMGASKRVAELYCQSLKGKSGTTFVVTRFGNVLGSAGSVVPLFQRQIEIGGPVTVTHPEITRFFMTIPEAVSLILQAAAMGKGEEVFVLDMGQPVRIVELAQQMIRLSGYEPDRDIEIVFTGLRAGEKLYEELFCLDEKAVPTSHPKILRAECATPEASDLLPKLDRLRRACGNGAEADLYRALKQIVPEAEIASAAAIVA